MFCSLWVGMTRRSLRQRKINGGEYNHMRVLSQSAFSVVWRGSTEPIAAINRQLRDGAFFT